MSLLVLTYYVDRPGGMRAQMGDRSSMAYLWRLAADGFDVPVRWEVVRW